MAKERPLISHRILTLQKSWRKIKHKDQKAINRELLIKGLNAAHVGSKRGQNESWFGLAVETARGKHLAKAMVAYQEIVQIVEGRFNGNVEGQQYQIGKGVGSLIVFEAKVFGVPETFMNRLRKFLWNEIAQRRKEEGPRISKKKKKA